ncbi:MAG: host attachment protein [Pseudomonadota bacterium]
MDMPHDALVLICDSQKAFLMRNAGDEQYPNLQVLEAREQDNPPTHAQGSDRPGRLNDPFGHKSAVENTDWHRQAADRFVRAVVEDFRARLRREAANALILVAPAHVMGVLRQALGAPLRRIVQAEIVKDLVHHTPPEIEKILKAA